MTTKCLITMILIYLCCSGLLDPDMHFLEVVAPDAPPRIIVCAGRALTSIEIEIIHPNTAPYKINLADQMGYDGTPLSPRTRDLLIYGRPINRD